MPDRVDKTMNSLKVLVVDDNIINQKVAVKMLERLHIPSDVAVNGLEAVEAFKKMRYDLILMDIQMPDMDGLEATRTIRSIERNEYHTTIIAITANAMQGDRERCLQAGMDDYLAKPIKQIDIDVMVEKWLSVKVPSMLKKIDDSDAALQTIIDPIRLKEIKEIGDDSLLRELLSLYLGDLNNFSQEVNAAQSENNYRRIYESAHTLKGSSANMGIESIRQACIQMEHQAKDQNSVKIAFQLTAMQETMEQIRILITAQLSVK